MNISLWLEDNEYRLKLAKKDKNEIKVSIGDHTYHVSFEFLSEKEILMRVDGKIHSAIFNSNLTSHSVFINGKSFKVEKKTAKRILREASVELKKRDVKTSMPGKIVKVLVSEGDFVQKGQAVLILEAMKMQNEIKSPQSGQIAHLVPKPGDSVETGALLFSVE